MTEETLYLETWTSAKGEKFINVDDLFRWLRRDAIGTVLANTLDRALTEGEGLSERPN